MRMNYKGVSCPVCGQEFKEGDDIVVCPECGAPHHRSCYKQLGHCALQQELHEKGLEWKNPNEKKPLPMPVSSLTKTATSSVQTADCSARKKMFSVQTAASR